MYKNSRQALLILYEDGKMKRDLSGFEKEFIDGAKKLGASVTTTT